MNRILIAPSELEPDGTVRLTDRRARHIRTVLCAAVGDPLRIGLIGGATGTGTVTALSPFDVTLACALEAPPADRPPIDLLLALPRPKVMKRLWPVLAAFGLRRIGLLNAARVERVYFDSHVLAPAFYQPALIEGCEQAGLTRLPEVSVHRRLKPFVEDALAAWSDCPIRLMAHPGAACRVGAAVRRGAGVLAAVGPEGGWTDFERALLAAHGFTEAALAQGALRSDVACAALLAVVREAQV